MQRNENLVYINNRQRYGVRIVSRVRTDSSSDTVRGPVWLDLDSTRSAGVNGINLLSVHSVVYVY